VLDLTEGKSWKLLLQFSIPMLIGNVLMQLYHAADFYIVGNFIGPDAMASVGTTMPIIFSLVSFVIGITMASTVIVSQYFGAKDFVNLKRSIDTIIIFLVISSLIFIVIGLIICEPLLRFVGTPEDIMKGSKTFMQITLLGLLPLFGVNFTSAILRGVGDSKTPLYAMLISSCLNILILLAFVRVMRWGIAGAACATVVAQTTTTIGMILWLNKRNPFIKITIKRLAFDKDIFRNSIRIGLPNGIQQALVAVGQMAMLGIVNRFTVVNNDVLVAYTIVNRIDTLVMSPGMTFSIVIAAFVGQNIGARKPHRISSGLNATLLMSAMLTMVIAATMMIFAEPVMNLFSAEITPDVVAIGRRYLMIICPACLIFSAMFIYTGVMRGAGDTLVPMFITLLSLWLVRIPLASFLSNVMGLDGIWWSLPICWLVGSVCAFLYYRTGRWKNKGVIKL